MRSEFADKIGQSFNNLAMAATAKEEIMGKKEATIANLTASNSTLATTNATLTAENKRLNAEVARLLGGASGGGGGKVPNMAPNSAGIMCPTRKGEGHQKNYTFFVDKQKCGVCGKEAYHLPTYCPDLPEMKKRKQAWLERESKRAKKEG